MPRSRRKGRWLAAATFALGAVLVPGAVAGAADVEPGDMVYVGGREGYGGTGLFPIRSDGSPTGEIDYWAYCLEHDVPARTGLVGEVGDLDGYLGQNYFTDPDVQGKVLWVLAHSYPALSLEEFGAAAGVPGISRNDAIEATQYAIWRYTDLTWDAAWNFETPDSETAYWYLVEGANANPGLSPEELEVTATITAPPAPQSAGSLVGPFVVDTNQPTVTVSVEPTLAVTDGSGGAVDLSAVVDGQELYLDLRDSTTAGEAVVQVSAAGSSSTGRIVSVPTATGGAPTAGDHAQTIVLVAPSTTRTTALASVSWSAQPTDADPVIGTSLVDSADGDRVLPWNGGTVVDTIDYQNLTPGIEYTVSGELVRKSDSVGTGITGSTAFTPAEADGSVDVMFVVPDGYAGEDLVAFERLHVGTQTATDPVAVHEDIDDAAQTVTIEALPQTPAPVIGTSLVDSADGDRALDWRGGTVIDTVSYQNLVPGTEYTVTGELVRKSDGTSTGITGSTTFTPAETDGSVDVTFVVPAGRAGETLVAFEELHVGTDTTSSPVAEHTDINDAAQTVTVAAAPVTSASPTEGNLPATGAGVTGLAVGAASLLLLGTVFLLVRRARARA
ncbi:VaFE repeat-containing surface-anchored protein [Cellulosimicrobium cellulans]|uniref:VaFE repeat-containing surface-anchored protein n=1 Tax=Cellulosimicrobium cellulans TaxID=1710 RepID=UPI00364F8E0A